MGGVLGAAAAGMGAGALMPPETARALAESDTARGQLRRVYSIPDDSG